MMYPARSSITTKLLQNGFTLIELIIVFSIIATLSVVGVASFVSFGRQQSLNSTADDVKTLFYKARSQTNSQVNSQCPQGQQFQGYKILFCCRSGFCPTCISKNDYEMDLTCGANSFFVEGKKYPPGITLDSQKTTSQSFSFTPISGGISGSGAGASWNVVFDGFGKAKQITVSNIGVIQ